ncbi:CHASE4 domain-containing protein [Bacteroidota bacterium]
MRIHTSNIRNKIIFILGILVVFYVVAFIVSSEIDKRKTHYLHEEQRIIYYDNLEKILNIKGAAYKNLVENLYSRWDELGDFIQNPDPSFAKTNLDILLTRYDYDCIWIYNPSQKIIFQRNATIDASLTVIPVMGDFNETIFTDSYYTHFFFKSHGGLLEIRGAKVIKGESGNSMIQPDGYFFLGRLWDNVFLKDLEEAMDCKISIHDVGYEIDEEKALELNDIPVMKSMYAWNGKEVARTEFLIHELLLEKFDSYASNLFLMFIIMAIIIIVVISFFLIEWIYNPLRLISASLINNNPVGLEKLKKKDNEFGRLATLMIKTR